MTRTTIIRALIIFAAAALLAAVAGRRLAGAQNAIAAAEAQLLSALQQAAELSRLADSGTEQIGFDPSYSGLLRIRDQALQAAGVPLDTAAGSGIDENTRAPRQGVSNNNTAIATASATLRFGELTPPEIGAFLDAFAARAGQWRVTRIELRHAGNDDRPDLYRLTLSVESEYLAVTDA